MNTRNVYQEISLVKTPLLICSSRSADYYYEDKTILFSSKSMRDWEHLSFESPIFNVYHVKSGGSSVRAPVVKTNDKTIKAPFVSPMGEVSAVIPFSYPAKAPPGEKGWTAPQIAFRTSVGLHLKGGVWRAQNAGLSKVGDLVGLQLHFKLQNVERILCSTSQSVAGAGGVATSRGVVLYQPPGMLPGQEWEQDCVVPVAVGKSGENSGTRIYIYAYAPAGTAGTSDKAEITLSKMVLVSHAD